MSNMTSPNSQPDDEIIPIDEYNAENGKLQASIRWLISKVYENNIPDQLVKPFMRDASNQVLLKPPAMYSLTSGELYCAAAAKLFQDSTFLTQNHHAVLTALHRSGIDVRDADGERVTETSLKMEAPLKVSAHMAVIDALMTAHVRHLVSVDRVVGAVGKYVHVDEKEMPVDVEDALLFWINKICAAVRENLEKIQRRQGGAMSDCPVIPEMEDLYEDMCDGACVCTLVAFYRPQALRAAEICLNDPMGIGDCAYNLRLLRDFCTRQLPINVWHFNVEDILYLHECFQPNVNAFLADIFNVLELQGDQSGHESSRSANLLMQAQGLRRQEPIQGIPDLRGQQSSNNSRTSATNQTFAKMMAQSKQQPSGVGGMAPSMMNSMDSLMTHKSFDSVKYNRYKPTSTQPQMVKKSPTTTFGDINSAQIADTNGGAYNRSDSMPGASASIRLALEEKRRQYNTQRANLNAQLAKEREQKSRDAFFTLLGKQPPAQAHGIALPPDARPVTAPQHSSVDTSQLENLNKDMAKLMAEVKRISMDQEQIYKRIDEQNTQEDIQRSMMSLNRSPSHGRLSQAAAIYAQPVVAVQQQGSPAYLQQPQQQHSQHSSPGIGAHYATMPANAFAAAYHQHQQQLTPQHNATFTMTPQGGHQYYPSEPSTPVYRPTAHIYQQQQSISPPAQPQSAGQFRLHTDNEPPSRLDPSLELNRNLTNWGMTYKTPSLPRQTPRRTWDSEMWQQAMAGGGKQWEQSPMQPSIAEHTIDMNAPPGATTAHWGRRAADSASTHQLMTQSAYQQLQGDERASTSSYSPAHVAKAKSVEPMGSAALVIGLGDSHPDRQTMEMEQKREQLLANAIRRKENLDRKRDQMEAAAAAKRAADEKKLELAEQKKMEKDMHRQRIRDEYDRRKAEQSSLENSLSGVSTGGTPRSPNKLTPANRGKSQPPSRPKSQLIESNAKNGKLAGSQQRLNRSVIGQDSVDNENTASTPNGNAPMLTERSERRLIVPSVQSEPDVKPYVKPTQKSNRNIMMNALQYSVFAGAVHDEQRKKVMEEMAKSDSKHFLLLFRDQKCQFRAVYGWDETSDNCVKLFGNGPKTCFENMMMIMFKYDSGAKSFLDIPASKHLSPTVDAFCIKDSFWKKTAAPAGSGKH